LDVREDRTSIETAKQVGRFDCREYFVKVMPQEVSDKRQEPHFHRYEDLVRYYENFFEPGSTLSYTGKEKKKIASPGLPQQQRQQ
jgi:hypothetical protein